MASAPFKAGDRVELNDGTTRSGTVQDVSIAPSGALWALMYWDNGEIAHAWVSDIVRVS